MILSDLPSPADASNKGSSSVSESIRMHSTNLSAPFDMQSVRGDARLGDKAGISVVGDRLTGASRADHLKHCIKLNEEFRTTAAPIVRIGLTFPANMGVSGARHAVAQLASTPLSSGVRPGLLLLSDRAISAERAPLPALRTLVNESREPGVFRATLVAQPVARTLLHGHPTTFWQYNDGVDGPVVGPLIDVHEGDTVEIRFVNRLAQPSTIHWHGLPVPPDQDGNPANAVAPGATRVYRFTLPPGSAGTYWYHPHPHQLSAEQVFRGLAGPISSSR